jgi:hypothetical protein
MSKLNVGILRPTEAFTVPIQNTSTRNATDHATGSIIYNSDTNAAQVLTANDGWLNLGKGKVVASGGTETTPGDGYKYHAFTQTGNTFNFTITQVGFGASIELLVVAGGGGGGGSHSGGGGGGAGGVLWQPQWFPITGTYQVRVGAGGDGGPPGSYYTNGYYYTGQGDGNFFHGRRGEDSYLRKTDDSQLTFLAIGGGGGMESFYTNREQRSKTTTNYWGQPDGHEEKNGGNGGGSGDHYTGVESWVTHNLGGRSTQGNFGGYGYGNSGGSRYAYGPGPHNGPYNRKDDGNYPQGNGGGDGGRVPRYRGMNGHGQDNTHGQPHEGAGGGGCGGYELGRLGSNTDYGQVNWPAEVKGWQNNAPGSGGPGRYFSGFEAWGTTETNGTSGTKGWFAGGGDGGQYSYTTNGIRGANNKGGGGGQGSHFGSYSQAAGTGIANTGGGGGGGSSNNNGGGNQGGTKAGTGGSGIVLIRYKV